MDKQRDQVSVWLSEVEDDYLLNDSDDTDADPDYVIQNNKESESSDSDDSTISNAHELFIIYNLNYK